MNTKHVNHIQTSMAFEIFIPSSSHYIMGNKTLNNIGAEKTLQKLCGEILEGLQMTLSHFLEFFTKIYIMTFCYNTHPKFFN